MTREEIISGLQMTMDLVQFDPSTGNVRPVYTLNDLDKTTYLACKEAVKALKAQIDKDVDVPSNGDTIYRQAAIDLVEDLESARLKGKIDLLYPKMVKGLIGLPSAQPEHFADVSNMDDGELDFVQKHEKIPVELMVSSQPKPCDDAVSRQTLQKELALYPIDDITSEDEAGYNRAINDVQKMVLHLPSAQPEIIMCKDCIHIHDNDCPIDWGKTDYDFCSYAERRADGFD